MKHSNSPRKRSEWMKISLLIGFSLATNAFGFMVFHSISNQNYRQLESKIHSLQLVIQTQRSVIKNENAANNKSTLLIHDYIADLEKKVHEGKSKAATEADKTEDNITDLKSNLKRMRRKLKQANQNFEKVREKTKMPSTPKNPADTFDQAKEKLETGHWREAEKGFKQFIQDHPADSRQSIALYYLGDLHLKGSHYSQAFKEYKKVIELNPDSKWAGEAMYRLGDVFIKLDDCEKARVFLGAAARYFPRSDKNPQALRQMAQIDEGTLCNGTVTAALSKR